MSTDLQIQVTITGTEAVDRAVQALRNALADRRPLHAAMAGTAAEFTRRYLRGLNRHRTAQRLGAAPTNHYEAAAGAVTADATQEEAIIRIPRRTGLGRAFREITLRPTGGRKWLTIPATGETYGRTAGEFGQGTLDFAIIYTHRGPTPVLVWAADGGSHKKRDVAFWLRRSVTQKQDRSLLPSNDAFQTIARESAVAHIRNLLSPGGPARSTGMPSA